MVRVVFHVRAILSVNCDMNESTTIGRPLCANAISSDASVLHSAFNHANDHASSELSTENIRPLFLFVF